MNPFRIVSGGQTGVDRAALEFALAHGIRHGGWCPRGRRAEDGIIPRRYRLRETGSASYDVRTRWNVRDSDATVIFCAKARLSGGTKAAAEFAIKLGRPLLVLTGSKAPERAARQVKAFMEKHGVRTLNIAGPRASEQPEVGAFVHDVLRRCAAFLAGAKGNNPFLSSLDTLVQFATVTL